MQFSREYCSHSAEAPFTRKEPAAMLRTCTPICANVLIEGATFRLHLTGQLLICIVIPMAQVKAKLNGEAKQKHLVHSRQQAAVVSILRTANYVRRFSSPVFNQHGITWQQYNVLRILRGAGLGGLPTLDIAERMIEQAPGITRLLDRLEGKKLVRRGRPFDNRRQGD